MAVHLQRAFKSILLPALLLLLLFIWHDPLGRLVINHGASVSALIYGLFTTGLLLSLLFLHSREFFNLLVLLLGYLSLDLFIWNADPLSDIEILYALLCLLLPLNLLINDLQLERGILNRHGLQRVLLISVQMVLVIWALASAPQWLVNNLFYAPVSLIAATPIPPLMQLLILLIGITLLIFVFSHPSTLQSALLVTFISLVAAMHLVEQPQQSRLFFLLAGLIMLSALLQNTRLLAYNDELTGLPSRRALHQELLGQGNRYSIAMVDVDHFKKLNDSYGHDVGDQVLKMLASKLERVKGGKAFRYGGEEFTLIFPGKLADVAVLGLEELREKVAEVEFKIREKSRPRKRPAHPKPRPNATVIGVTISIGVADTRLHDNPQTLMKLADKALYRAKRKGRNQTIVASKTKSQKKPAK